MTSPTEIPNETYPGVDYADERDVMERVHNPRRPESPSESGETTAEIREQERAERDEQLRAAALEVARSMTPVELGISGLLNNAKALENYLRAGTVPDTGATVEAADGAPGHPAGGTSGAGQGTTSKG